MIRHNTLFVKVTRTSPIWQKPQESWEQIELKDLPENAGGIIEFKPIPPESLPEEKKDYKISVIMPKAMSESQKENAGISSIVTKEDPTEILNYIGAGKTITGVGFKLYEASPSEVRKDYVYVMEMETGKKYAATKSTIDEMVELFDRLHSVKDCTTLEELKSRLLRATDNVAPINNVHYFRIFFHLLMIRGLVDIVAVEGKQNKFKIVICKT